MHSCYPLPVSFLYSLPMSSLATRVMTVCGAIRRKCAVVPLYQPLIPSALAVLYRQSKGLVYNAPRTLPVTGSVIVFSGVRTPRHLHSRLYIRVKTVSAGCIAAQTTTPDTLDAARYIQKLSALIIPWEEKNDFA